VLSPVIIQAAIGGTATATNIRRREPPFYGSVANDRNEIAPPHRRPSISMARVHFVRGRKTGHVTQVGTIPPKTLIGAKRVDLASQSGRNWLSAGGHSRLWLIKSALKDKGSAFRQLLPYQNSNPIN
jgi:hypothetical protein